MEELDIGSALADASGMSEQPAPEMINADVPDPMNSPTEAQTQPAPSPELQQQPQFNPSQMENAMATQSQQIQEIASQMSQINNRMPEPTPQAMSEEEQIQAKIKSDLGIDKMEAQYAQQQELMQKQEQMIAQMQEQENVRQRETQFKTLESEYGNIDREAIQNHLVELNKNNPQLAEALNSPEGVRMLISQGVGAVVAKPDAVTPSASGADMSTTDASTRVLDGKGTSDDFGSLLESYAG